MKSRCSDPSTEYFYQYGGRGITVCDKWLTFEGFFSEMGTRPEGMTIDRIDTNGNYCRDNCRWATPKEQANNKRCNHLVSYKGKMVPIAVVSEQEDIKYGFLYDRIVISGWSVEDAISVPKYQHANKWRKENNNGPPLS